MQHDSQQVQTFGDIAMGDGNVFTINQIIQVTASEIQTRLLNPNSPYQGLKRFEMGDRDLFFGRDQLIAKLIDNLRQHNHLLVLGASGSGKSSVMRAGVVPQLMSQLSNTLQTFTFTPDRNPFRSLWGCLVSGGVKQSDADCVLDNPDDALLTLIKHHKPASAQWLFFIDQFEEIFTLCQDLDQRQSFIRNLLQASSVGQGAIKIVLAMRADFLDRFGSYPELGQIVQQNIYLITDMHPDELRLAIEQPAAKHGVVFEAGLVDEIIRDLEGQAGALPLLQYTLDLLWQRSDLGDRTLRCKTYRELGGVRGALQQRVEDLYGGLDECDRTTTKQIFLRLIDITGAAEEMDVVGKAVSRRAALSEFDHEAAQKVLPQLIDANLLVSNRQDTSTVELAHETLINAWPKLKQWIDDSKEVIVMQNRLSDDAQHWQQMQIEDRDHARDELWRGAKLQRALELREEGLFALWLGGLNQEESAFLEASVESRDRAAREEEHRRRQQLQLYKRFAIGASALLACIAVLSVSLRVEWIKAEQQKILETAKSSEYAFGAFQANRYTLDALLEGLEAGRAIQRGFWAKRKKSLNAEVLSALSSAAYWVSERNRLEGHKDFVADVAFSPDGQWIATTGGDQTVRLWDSQGIFIRDFPVHSDSVTSIAFSPDSKKLLTGSLDGTAALWTLLGENLSTFKGYDQEIFRMALSPDGKKMIAVGKGSTIMLWQVDKEEAVLSWQGDTREIRSVAFAPQYNSIITGGEDGIVKMWSLDGNLTKVFEGHKLYIMGVALSPNGQTLISASGDGVIKLWDIQTKAEILEWEAHTRGLYTAALSPDGETIATGGYDNTVKLWSVASDLLETFEGHQALVTNVRFSPNGKILASASNDKTAKLWQVKNAQLHKLVSHKSWVQDLAFSQSSSLLATASFDGTIRLWLPTGELQHTIKDHDTYVNRVKFSADGQVLYSGDFVGNVGRWDAQTQQFKSFSAHPDGQVRGLAINQNANLIATSGDDQFIRLWSPDGQLQKEFKTAVPNKSIYDVAFAQDGQMLVAAHENGQLTFWDIDAEKKLKTVEAHEGPIYRLQANHQSHQFLSAGGDGYYKLWTFDGEQLMSCQGHNAKIFDVAYSPDENLIASVSEDKTIKLWDRDCQLVLTMKGHLDSINAVELSPDGNWLASGSNDQLALLWNLDNSKLDNAVRTGCQWLVGYLYSQDRTLCPETEP